MGKPVSCTSSPAMALPKAMKAKKALILRGSKLKTQGGLKADDLMKNKRGKVVSKRQSASGKRRFSNIESWVEATMAARKALHVTGFCAINGKTLQGKALYCKAKAICQGLKEAKSKVFF